MYRVPPSVDKTCCDCQHHEQGKPAAGRVEESLGVAFPRVNTIPSNPRRPPMAIPARANRKVGPSQKESRKVKLRKKAAEKLVAHTFTVATQRRPCRRAVPAR